MKAFFKALLAPREPDMPAVDRLRSQIATGLVLLYAGFTATCWGFLWFSEFLTDDIGADILTIMGVCLFVYCGLYPLARTRHYPVAIAVWIACNGLAILTAVALSHSDATIVIAGAYLITGPFVAGLTLRLRGVLATVAATVAICALFGVVNPEIRWQVIALIGSFLLGVSSIAVLGHSMLRTNEFDMARFRALLNQSDNAIFIIDADAARIVDLNAGAERMLGRPRTDLLGRSPLDPQVGFPLASVEEWMQMLIRVRDGFERFQGKVRGHGGVEIPAEVVVSLHEVEGRGYILAILKDKTRDLEREAIIRDQQVTLVEQSRLSGLGLMAAGIAHEINNPLSIIQGKAEYLGMLLQQGKASEDKIEKCLRSLQKSSDRIAKIIRGLRTFARDSRKDPMEPEAVAALIDDTLEFCEQRIRNAGIELIRPEVDPGLAVECRPAQIVEVLINLLNNAYDAIEELPERWIRVEVLERGDMVVIAVTDSGRGIPKNVAGDIMQPFYTTKPVGKGTGLGLALSLGIMTDHGGELVVCRDHPHTRFEAILPRRQKAAA